MRFLSTEPLWITAIILLVAPPLFAMACTVLIRYGVTLDGLKPNNEVAGFKFATVGVLYAVLLAFAVIVVWEKFNDSENLVAKEAGAAATMYRLAEGIGGAPGHELHERLNDYLKAAIDLDWPAMERSEGSPAVTQALNQLYKDVLAIAPGNARDGAILAEVLHQLDLLTDARRTRLVVAAGVVPGVLWTVLFAGAILTVGFTFFFGAPNLRAQTAMTGILTLLIFSGLFVIVVIDHPFAGSVRVAPEALAAVLEDLGK